MNRLSRNVTRDHILEIFSVYGKVASVDLPTSRNFVHPGYAYVEYEDYADCEKAMKHMNGGQIDGQEVLAQFVLDQRKREVRPRKNSPQRGRPSWRRSPPRRSPQRRSPPRRSPPRRSPVRRSPVRRSPGRRYASETLIQICDLRYFCCSCIIWIRFIKRKNMCLY